MTLQLLVVHLGNTGEFGSGLPDVAPYRTPETHLVGGRGDRALALIQPIEERALKGSF